MTSSLIDPTASCRIESNRCRRAYLHWQCSGGRIPPSGPYMPFKESSGLSNRRHFYFRGADLSWDRPLYFNKETNMRFKLNFGTHRVRCKDKDKVTTYNAGDVIESDSNLAAAFQIFDVEKQLPKFSVVEDGMVHRPSIRTK